MKRFVIVLGYLFIFNLVAYAQLESGFSIELGSAVWIPSEQNKAVTLGFSIEPKYRFKYFGLGLQYERGVLSFGIDEFQASRNRNTPRRPFMVTEASLKRLSSIHAILELYPFGFEDKVALRLGAGIYRRGRVPKYDLIEMNDFSLAPRVSYGGSVGVLYNWKKTSAFIQLNSINKRGPDEGLGLTNYWSSGIVYHLNLKTKNKTNYEVDDDRRLVFRVEFGPEVNIPVGKIASAASLGLYTDVKFYVKNKIYFGGSFSFSQNKRGNEKSFIVYRPDSSNSGNNNIDIISNKHIQSQILSSSFIGGWIIKRELSSFIAIGGGPTLFKSFELLNIINQTSSQIPSQILPEKRGVGATIRIDYNLGYMNHSLTCNLTPKEMPFYISYKMGIGLNFTKIPEK